MAFPLTDREIFAKVWRDSIKNVLWYGAQVIVIAVIGAFVSWWVGIALWAICGLVLIAGGIQTLFVALLGIILIPWTIYESLKGREVDGKGQLHLAAGQVIQLIEMGVYACYFYWLYTIFFK
jgi:hypothetical protein